MLLVACSRTTASDPLAAQSSAISFEFVGGLGKLAVVGVPEAVELGSRVPIGITVSNRSSLPFFLETVIVECSCASMNVASIVECSPQSDTEIEAFTTVDARMTSWEWRGNVLNSAGQVLDSFAISEPMQVRGSLDVEGQWTVEPGEPLSCTVWIRGTAGAVLSPGEFQFSLSSEWTVESEFDGESVLYELTWNESFRPDSWDVRGFPALLLRRNGVEVWRMPTADTNREMVRVLGPSLPKSGIPFEWNLSSVHLAKLEFEWWLGEPVFRILKSELVDAEARLLVTTLIDSFQGHRGAVVVAGSDIDGGSVGVVVPVSVSERSH